MCRFVDNSVAARAAVYIMILQRVFVVDQGIVTLFVFVDPSASRASL